ncbi:MAG: hypothetical protein WCP86_04405 [bacterium]
MKNVLMLLLVAVAVVSGPRPLLAQYAMDMKLDNPSYLQFEAMEARVVVRNDTDRLLLIGGLRETAVVEFSIRRNNQAVQRRRTGMLVENALIMPGQTRELKVDLGRYYDIQQFGLYEITASLVADGVTLFSSPRVVDVVPGLELSSVVRAVPNHPSRMRRYTLRYWNRSDREMLFLCVVDEKEGVNYGVHVLGPVVRVVLPEMSFDQFGNVKVKHQSDNGVFAYTTLKSTVDGVVLVRQKIENDDIKAPGGRKPVD